MLTPAPWLAGVLSWLNYRLDPAPMGQSHSQERKPPVLNLTSTGLPPYEAR